LKHFFISDNKLATKQLEIIYFCSDNTLVRNYFKNIELYVLTIHWQQKQTNLVVLPPFATTLSTKSMSDILDITFISKNNL